MSLLQRLVALNSNSSHCCATCAKPPSESILVDSSLNFTASSSVTPLPIDSVAPRMYGLEVAPNMTLVKRYSLTFLSLKLSNQRTRWASWSCSCTLIWRKAFWISPVTQYFRISHLWTWMREMSKSTVSWGVLVVVVLSPSSCWEKGSGNLLLMNSHRWFALSLSQLVLEQLLGGECNAQSPLLAVLALAP